MSAARAFRLVANLAVLVGSVVFFSSNGSSLGELTPHLGNLGPIPVLVGVVLSGLGMLNRAGGARASHRCVGLEVPAWSMVRPTMVAFAADKVVRAFGFSGLTVMVRHGDQAGYPRALVFASTMVAKVTSFASLGVFLSASVLILWADNRLTRWWLAAAAGFATYAVFGVVVIGAIAQHRGAVERWWERLERRTQLARSIAGPQPVDTIADGVRVARHHPARVALVLLHSLGSKLIGASMLLASVVAVGETANPGTVLVIYSTALLASVASVSPGGVGAVEVSMVAVLVGSGVEFGAAVVIVALFRLLDLWLPLAAGGTATLIRRRLRHVNTSGEPVVMSAVEPAAQP